MKTVVLTVSEFFPKGHPMEGKPTYFVEKIKNGQKIHTIRLNFEHWQKQIKKVTDGEAVLSIRTWSGQPYNSKQVERVVLDANDGVGIEEIWFDQPLMDRNGHEVIMHTVGGQALLHDVLAINDGLSQSQFESWFNPFPKKPSAIIHFTDFRYERT